MHTTLYTQVCKQEEPLSNLLYKMKKQKGLTTYLQPSDKESNKPNPLLKAELNANVVVTPWVSQSTLIHLITQKDFCTFICYESFISYISSSLAPLASSRHTDNS
jgi:hypothetical protein